MIIVTTINKEGAEGSLGIKLENVGNVNPSVTEGVSWLNYFDKGEHRSIQVKHSVPDVQQLIKLARGHK